MRFEPRGASDNPEFPQAHPIPDHVARWLASRFLEWTRKTSWEC